MLTRSLAIYPVLLLALSVGSPPALAGNEGQEYLDRAIEARLSATALPELGEVVRLCQSALEKGLDKENTAFAKQLLASTLVQRAQILVESIYAASPPHPRWAQFRQAALVDLEQALQHDPKLAFGHLLVGRLNVLPGGDRKRAMEALNEAVRLSDDDPDTKGKALVARAGVQEELEKRMADLGDAIKLLPGDPQALRSRGAVYLVQNKPAEALVDFDAALKIDSEHAPTYEARGLALAAMGKLDEARKSYEQAAKLAPKSSSGAYLQMGRIDLAGGDAAKAIEDTTAALETDPDNPVARLLRAQARHQVGQLGLAMEDANHVLKMHPGLAPALRTRAILFAASGKIDEAVADLEALLKEVPKDAETLFRLAILYNEQQKIDKVIAAYSGVIETAPQSWLAYRGRADAYLAIGKHKPAVADYNKALEIEPKDAGLLNNLAWVLATSPLDEIRDGKRSIELAIRACEQTDYKAAHILSTLAAGYAETDDFENAIRWAKKAIETAPDELREDLTKELKTYQSGKPMRELQGASEDPSQDDKP